MSAWKIVVPLAAISLFGCEQLLGVSDYSVANPPGSASQDAGKVNLCKSAAIDCPPLPALPDQELVDGCTKCAKDNCAPQYHACLESERCRDRLDCQGRCISPFHGASSSDPNCIEECAALPPSPAFYDFFDCVFAPAGDPISLGGPSNSTISTQCTDECGVGKNWGCVGKFTWDDRPNPGFVMVDVQVYNVLDPPGPFSTLTGTEIGGCRDDSGIPLKGDADCGPTWVSLDGYGRARVTLTLGQKLFSIRGGENEQHRIYPPPIAQSGSIPLAVFAIGNDYSGGLAPTIESAVRAGQITSYETALGVLVSEQVDCVGVAASTEVELTPRVQTTTQFYWIGSAASFMASSGIAAIFVNVPAGRAVELTSKAGAKLVSQRTAAVGTAVMVAPKWLTTVVLSPMDSRGQ